MAAATSDSSYGAVTGGGHCDICHPSTHQMPRGHSSTAVLAKMVGCVSSLSFSNQNEMTQPLLFGVCFRSGKMPDYADFPHESVVITRNFTSDEKGVETFVPSRFLKGMTISSSTSVIVCIIH